VVNADAGGGKGGPGDDQPQTYIRRPNIYKHHVRIGATRNTSHECVTESASRPHFCASCIMFRHVCQPVSILC
jgi:hypothetical protein